jgi:aminoglycoside phosphotransferase (APT) family kinase protein
VSDATGAPRAASPQFVKQQRDPEATRATLEKWFSERLGAPVEIYDLQTPSGAGVSNETFLLRATWRRGGVQDEKEYVLRLHPSPEYQVFYEPQFRTQFDLMETLARVSAVRVPQVYWYEDDTGPFGRPFFVMERIHGNVPVSMPLYNREGFLFDATPEQRRRGWESTMAQFAAIHTVPVDQVQMLDRPEWGATAIEQQLNYWECAAKWGLADRYPAELDEMIGWLRASLPDDDDRGLSWGDARMGNVMFGENFDVAAMLDWEQASLIGPTADLAWWLFFEEMYSVGQGVPLLEGMGTREQTLERWCELTGREPRHLEWHEVFVGYKMANLAIRTTVVMTSARGAAPAMTLSVVNGALGRLNLGPLETL